MSSLTLRPAVSFVRSARTSLLTWLASRTALVLLYAFAERRVVLDVAYYHSSLEQLGHLGIDRTLVEYPVPAVALLWIPDAVADSLGDPHLYAYICALFVLAIDAIFMLALIGQRSEDTRRSGRAIPLAELAWILAIPALGATPLARFDLVPGALVGLALLYAARHPRVSGVLVAVATSIKYWPAIIIPGFLTRRRGGVATFVSIAATGLTIAFVCLVTSDMARLTSPFTYQDTRGLQIESITATPIMLGWAFSHGAPWYTFDAISKSFEVRGPGVNELQVVSTGLSVLAVVIMALLWFRAWRSQRESSDDSLDTDALVWITISAVLLFIVSSKVFSPQYLLWVLPAGAAAVAIVSEPRRRFAVRWMSVLLIVALITQVIFPIGYGNLHTIDAGSELMAVILACRNLSIVGLTVAAIVEAFRATVPREVRAPSPSLDPAGTLQH